MAEFGNFELCDDDLLLYLLFDNDILAALDLPFMAPASVEETEEVEKELKMSDMEGLPSPGMPTPPSKRFKSMTEEDLKQFEDSRQSISTKRNTQWGVKLFQGMGESVNVDELKMIASKPSNMFMEKSVTVNSIAQTICNGAINDQENKIPSNNQDCSGAFDIVFVLDSSWSLNSEKNFQKELHFVTELANDLRLDFNHASASVITYADEAKEHIFQNGNDFMQTVLNLPWIGGNTNTDKALSILLQHVERKTNSVQSDFGRPLVVILISDGGSTSPFRLEEVVSRLKKYKFVKLFAIGVGVSINTKELSMIASDPSDNHMFMVDDLGVNNKILKSLLTSQICRDAKYLSLASPTASFSCPSHADLVFVLDSSSSLGIVGNPDFNFRKEVAFVIDVIKEGITDFRKSRVSVITFSDVMTLNQYFDEDDLIKNVTRLPFLGGNTYTDIALELMLDELRYLNSVSNARKPAVGIVLTDGHSTRPKLTSNMTRRIHESGFRIVAIAPPSDFTDCSKPVDLVFVLDSSWSLMAATNFLKELKFVTEVVNALSDNMGQSRISVITFSDDAEMSIPLTMFTSKRDFVNKVLNLPWVGGNTYTDKALEMMYKQFDSIRVPGRRSVGVVITDGGSTNPFRTQSVIKKVKQRGITMFAIGVGMSINQEELQMMASDPVSDHKFLVDDLDALQMLRSTIVSRLCPGRSTRPPICESDPADIFFIVDKSSSLQSQENFNKELSFIARIIDSIIVGTGRDDSRVGLISFSTNASLSFGLSAYTTNDAVKDALLREKFTTGDTYTHKAFNIMLEQFRNTARRDPRVKKIGFIVTDGQSTDPNTLKQYIEQVKATNIEMYAVGCCEKSGAGDFDSEELNMMASKPSNVFHVDDLDDLRTISVELNLKRCRNQK